jgi:hypothetical protein
VLFDASFGDFRGLALDVRIQKVQRHAPDLLFPDLGLQLIATF